MSSLSPREAAIFAQFSHMPALLVTLLGLSDQFPAFSTVISNVPGPKDQLYWNGARLDGIYPASIITHGGAMNITLVSYNKSMHFGIIACHRSIPQVQQMIGYLEESLQELENLAGIRAVKGKQATSTKRKTKVKRKGD
jgi:diacylglycerol O-acyltransferase